MRLGGRAVTLLALLAAFGWGCNGDDDDTGVPAGDDDSAATGPQPISVGPIVGGVSHGDATVMVRMAGPTEVVVEVGEIADFSGEVIAGAPVAVDWGRDCTGHSHLTGLAPDTLYHLRVLAAGEVQETNVPRHFRTAPPPDTWFDFQFGVLADVVPEENTDYSWSYSSLGAEILAFVMQIGDLDHRDPGDMEPLDIENWRLMHRQQLKEYDQGELLDYHLLSRTPLFHVWDDHDYGSDNAEASAAFKDVARQAFFEYFPVPADVPNPEYGIWHRFQWAQIEVFMLDLRSQRSDNLDPDSADKSMLAVEEIPDDQKTWFLEGLRDSTAVWKFVVSSSVWNTHSKEEDCWALYPAERQQILDWIDEHDITGVIVISGDIHSGGGIDDGTYADLPEITVPCTNMIMDNCTCGYCGEWSEGIWVGNEPAGYALVSVSHDPVEQLHRVLLKTYDRLGYERFAYEMTQPG